MRIDFPLITYYNGMVTQTPACVISTTKLEYAGFIACIKLSISFQRIIRQIEQTGRLPPLERKKKVISAKVNIFHNLFNWTVLLQR